VHVIGDSACFEAWAAEFIAGLCEAFLHRFASHKIL